MKFTPRSEQEIHEMSLMPEGIYPFVVIEANERMSKKGSEMIEIKLEVIDNHNRSHTIFDYLLEAMQFKLIHFCEHTGILDKYESGNLTAQDCLRKRGWVELKADKAPRIVDGREYPPKNSVKDYCADGGVKSPQTAPLGPEFQDDCPF